MIDSVMVAAIQLGMVPLQSRFEKSLTGEKKRSGTVRYRYGRNKHRKKKTEFRRVAFRAWRWIEIPAKKNQA